LIRHAPHREFWLIEPLPQWPDLRPIFIALSIFCWVFVLWILFWFYKAARSKYERFLVAAFAISFALNMVKPFVSRELAVHLHLISTAASLVALAAALTLFLKLENRTQEVRTEDHCR
jgi:hypothetical protein